MGTLETRTPVVANKTTQSKQIFERMDFLTKSIEDNEILVKGLGDRLEYLRLIPDNAKAVGIGPVETLAPMASTLQNYIDRIESTNRSLRELLDELQV